MVLTKIQVLRDNLHKANHHYYVLSDPKMSDAEYDAMFDELVKLEQADPSLITPDSPTQRVGSDLENATVKVTHVAPIQSLNKAKTDDDIRAWQQRNATMVRASSGGSNGYTLQPKIDGLTVVLTYRNGILVQAATRGDGTIGEDVTAVAKTIKTIPLRLSVPHDEKSPSYLVVRGEVLIKKDDFTAYNTDGIHANPRNLASGRLKQRTTAESAKTPLWCEVYRIVAIAYDTDGNDTNPLPVSNYFERYIDTIAALERWGFVVAPTQTAASISEVVPMLETWRKVRDSYPYEIDGVVVSVNSLDYYDRLGYVGKDPRGAIAYKFPSQEIVTRLRRVVVTEGRTGVMQPNAIVDKVNIGGVMVERASLHNYDVIADLDLRIGDYVILKRSGDVIPYISASVPERRTGNETPILPPENCPFCGSKVEQRGAKYYCSNNQCPERAIRMVEYWCSKACMDIDGMGETSVRQIVSSGLVRDVSDIYRLTTADLLKLDGWADGKANGLVAAIIESRDKTEWWKIVEALGIEGVGSSTSREFKTTFKGLWDLALAAKSNSLDAYKVAGVGKITIKTLHDWFNDMDNIELLKKLEAVGLRFESDNSAQGNALQSIAGLTFVITGSMNKPREEIENLILLHGGRVSGSVSKNTNYLVAGDKSGSKLDKANKLGVSVITESELYDMIQTIPDSDDLNSSGF